MEHLLNEEIEQLREGNIIKVLIDPFTKEKRTFPIRICNYEDILETNKHIFSVSFCEGFQIFDFQIFSLCQFMKENNYMLWNPKEHVLEDGRVLHYWHEIQNLFQEKADRPLNLNISKEMRNLGVQKVNNNRCYNG